MNQTRWFHLAFSSLKVPILLVLLVSKLVSSKGASKRGGFNCAFVCNYTFSSLLKLRKAKDEL